MSNKIRQSIKGVSLFGSEVKLSQFADDTTLICANTKSVENAFQIATDFGRISGLSYWPCLSPLSSTYRRCRAGRRVKERRAIQEIFTELNPWFLIHALVEEAIICRKDPFQITSASIVKTADINNHVSSNVTSTNSSLHANSFVNPRSTFLNWAVLNSRSVRNKIESITDHVVENDIGPCSVTETCLIK